MTTVAANQDYTSIGMLASQLQRPIRHLERAVQELEISPALRLNAVAYFDAEQVSQITEFFSRET